MKFRELCDAVLDGSDRPPNSARTTIRSIVNQVYADIVARVRLNEAESTVTFPDDTGLYSFVELVGEAPLAIRHILLPSPWQLAELLPAKELSQREVLAAQYDPSAIYWPAAYARMLPDSVLVAPIPNAGLEGRVFWCRRPEPLQSDEDEPTAVPFEFHDLIVVGGIARAARTRNVNVARAMREDFASGLVDLRRWRNHAGGAGSLSIRPATAHSRPARYPGIDTGI